MKKINKIINILIIIALVCTRPNSAFAQVASSDEPVMIKADTMDYDETTEIVVASGNVEIVQGDRILFADKLIYDRTTNIVNAEGNISLLEPDGNVYFAERTELQNDLKQGVVENFKARFSDNSLMAANFGIRQDENVIKLTKAVYSPCKVCAEKPDRPPLWQLKADQVKIDQVKEKTSYKNAKMEFWGVPLLYTPYFSHPTPDASSKSGLLAPSYSQISTLGFTAKIPYYYSLAPNKDLLVIPFLTSKEGPVLSGEYRQLTNNGFYRMAASITNPDKRDEFGEVVPGKNEIRGHVEAFGKFTLNENWSWGFDGKRATDDTYLRRYKFGEEDKLTSVLYAERIRDRNYLAIRGVTFQELNQTDDPGRTPFALPYAITHVETKPTSYGSRYELDANLLALGRSEGVKSRRASVSGGWRLPYISRSTGSLFEASARLRGDGYIIEDFTDPVTSRQVDKNTGRFLPEAKLEWSLPMSNITRAGNIMIEPIANFIVSPHGSNPSDIPNEDSQQLELSDVNIFSSNHLSGLDRVESGPRSNYGFRGGIYLNNGASANFLLGQSYRVKNDRSISNFEGIEDNFSDYVGRLSFYDGRIFDVSYRFRLDKEDLNPNRSEIGLGLNLLPLQISADYVNVNKGIFNQSNNREEINTAGNLAINENWSINGNARKDLSEGGGLISAGAGLIYQNECIAVTTSVSREFLRDRDIQPSTSYSLQISFKNIN